MLMETCICFSKRWQVFLEKTFLNECLEIPLRRSRRIAGKKPIMPKGGKKKKSPKAQEPETPQALEVEITESPENDYNCFTKFYSFDAETKMSHFLY